MARSGQFSLCLILMAAATPLFAQVQDDRIQQLEKRLNDLTGQVAQIRSELDQLKGATPTAAATPAAAADAQDLTKVDIINAPKAPAPVASPVAAAPTDQSGTELTGVQTINNDSNPGLSKVFNPDTSAIGNFIGKAGQTNPFEFGPGRDQLRQTLRLDEAEVGLQAFVDPYAKANFFLSATPAGLSVEEGYIQFVTLPYDLTAKVGKFKALFGKANTWHTHVRPWVDQPLVIHNFFTDDQFADDGISVSKVFPSVKGTFLEATGEVFRGQVNGVFDNRAQNDVAFNAHLKAFRDLSENTNLEAGTSYARGTLAESISPSSGTNQYAGIDVTYRWKPLQQGLYRGLIGRFEGIVNDRENFSHRLFGFYASADYQLSSRLFTGVRIDRADRTTPFTDLAGGFNPSFRKTDRGVSASMTFWPSEFSQFRGQLRRTSYGGARSVTELLFQLQFAIGAHGAHTF